MLYPRLDEKCIQPVRQKAFRLQEHQNSSQKPPARKDLGLDEEKAGRSGSGRRILHWMDRYGWSPTVGEGFKRAQTLNKLA